MKVQISLDQNDIEAAVRAYVAESGITNEVDEVKFSTSRKGGSQSIEAEIKLADDNVAPAPESEPKADKPAKPAAKKDQTSKADKKAETKEPEEVKGSDEEEAGDTPPFDGGTKDVKSANDSAEEAEEEPTQSKSLFG